MVRVIPLLALTACSPGIGTVEVTAWGEDEATTGLSSDDGWTIDFDRWVIAVGRVQLADPKDEAIVAIDESVRVMDVATGAPILVTELEAPAERLLFGFDFPAPDGGSTVDEGLDDIAVTMAEAGWAQWVSGTATDGTDTLAFSFGVQPAAYRNCTNGRDNTDGIAPPRDGRAEATLTLHADHPFWTALGTEESSIEFQAWADADADADGTITDAELSAVATVDLGYETSGLVEDLGSMISFSTAQAAHVNGSGLCSVRRLE